MGHLGVSHKTSASKGRGRGEAEADDEPWFQHEEQNMAHTKLVRNGRNKFRSKHTQV